MKKEIKKYIKRLVRWAFQSHILVYSHSQFISDIDLVQSKGEIIFYIKREIANKLAEKLLEDGVIEFEEISSTYPYLGRNIRSKINIIK